MPGASVWLWIDALASSFQHIVLRRHGRGRLSCLPGSRLVLLNFVPQLLRKPFQLGARACGFTETLAAIALGILEVPHGQTLLRVKQVPLADVKSGLALLVALRSRIT